MTAHPDVLVIGAGAIGVAAALELVKAGAEVVVVDEREAVGAECSYGNTGLITPSHCVPAGPLNARLPTWLDGRGLEQPNVVVVAERLHAQILEGAGWTAWS